MVRRIERPTLITMSALSLDTLRAELVSRAIRNGPPAVLLSTQPVWLGLVPVGVSAQLSHLFPATWYGTAGYIRVAELLIGPSGGATSYAVGDYETYARIQDVSERPMFKVHNGLVRMV